MNFRRTVVLLLAAGALATLTFNLGQWQSRRATEKEALETQRQAALDADELQLSSASVPDVQALRFRRVRLTGQFVPDAWVALDNRLINGRPAVSIIQAFRLQPDNDIVMVDRGLLLRDPAQPRVLPAFSEDAQTVTIQGFFLERFPRTAELWGLRVTDASQIHRNGREWSNFNVADFQREFASQLKTSVSGDFVVQQSGADSSGFVRKAPEWTSDVSKHRGYAFQWYSLTIVLLVGVCVLLWRKRRPPAAGASNAGAR